MWLISEKADFGNNLRAFVQQDGMHDGRGFSPAHASAWARHVAATIIRRKFARNPTEKSNFAPAKADSILFMAALWC